MKSKMIAIRKFELFSIAYINLSKIIITSRDETVHKIFVCKLHHTAQLHPHTALHHKKFVNLLHHTAKVKM